MTEEGGPPVQTGQEEALQRILQSNQFSRSEAMKRLLEYLWEKRGSDASEYAIAVDALGRRADFDPKLDAAVRVQISRLRAKLEHFYLTEGAGDTYRLVIPMGTHSLRVTPAPEAIEPEPVSEPSTVAEASTRPRVPGRTFLLPLLCTVILLQTLAIFWFMTQRRGLDLHESNANAGPPTQFWSQFFQPAGPVKIVLPTPVFFSYRERVTLHIRDVMVNDYRDWTRSEPIRAVTPAGVNPVLDHAYTVTSDTLAAIDLTRYFDTHGLGDRVTSGVTGDSTMNLLEQTSVIALGAHSTLHPFQDYLNVMNFRLSQNDAWVENLKPAKGEPSRFLVVDQGQEHRIEPGILAVLPGRSADRSLLILQARHTSALVNMLSSQVGDNLFLNMQRAHGSPRFYEMVILSDVDNDHVIRSWPVAMRAFSSDPVPVSEETR